MKKICFFLSFFFLLFGAKGLWGQPTITLSKTISGSGDELISDLIADHDGHLIAIGIANSVDRDTSCHYHGGATDIWLVKMDPGGGIVWQKCYGGSGHEDAYQIIQTIDDGFLFVGTTESSDGDVTVYHGTSIIWLVKIDSNGNIQWQQGLADGSPYHLMQLHDGKYLLACYTLNINSDFPVHYGGGFTEDAWVVFLSYSSAIDTAIRYGGSEDDFITEVIELSNGDLQVSTLPIESSRITQTSGEP